MVQKTTGTNRTAICYNSGMKKLLLTVLAIVTITVVGYAAAQHYQEYQNKQHNEQQAVASAQAAEIAQVKASAAAETQEWQSNYNAQVIECEKGRVAYDQLSAFSKSKVEAPQCGKKVAQ